METGSFKWFLGFFSKAKHQIDSILFPLAWCPSQHQNILPQRRTKHITSTQMNIEVKLGRRLWGMYVSSTWKKYVYQFIFRANSFSGIFIICAKKYDRHGSFRLSSLNFNGGSILIKLLFVPSTFLLIHDIIQNIKASVYWP